MYGQMQFVSTKLTERLGEIMGLGWILGEEILFSNNKQKLLRYEKCTSINDACVLQLSLADLSKMSSSKMGGGGSLKNDYKILVSYLEKNFEVKNEWRVKAGITKPKSN